MRAPQPGGLELHQGQQAVDFAVAGHQRGEDSPEAQRVLAERRAHPVLAGGGRVALVEDEVDHLEHRGQAVDELVAARDLERHARHGQGALGPHDALRDGPLANQKRACNLRRR